MITCGCGCGGSAACGLRRAAAIPPPPPPPLPTAGACQPCRAGAGAGGAGRDDIAWRVGSGAGGGAGGVAGAGGGAAAPALLFDARLLDPAEAPTPRDRRSMVVKASSGRRGCRSPASPAYYCQSPFPATHPPAYLHGPGCARTQSPDNRQVQSPSPPPYH